jgi:hypothetical protein
LTEFKIFSTFLHLLLKGSPTDHFLPFDPFLSSPAHPFPFDSLDSWLATALAASPSPRALCHWEAGAVWKPNHRQSKQIRHCPRHEEDSHYESSEIQDLWQLLLP